MKATELASWLTAMSIQYGNFDVFMQSENILNPVSEPCYRPITGEPKCIHAKPDQLLVTEEWEAKKREIEALPELLEENRRLRELTTPRQIEDAPMDGTVFLAYVPTDKYWWKCCWNKLWLCWINEMDENIAPTHWVPMPSKPEVI